MGFSDKKNREESICQYIAFLKAQYSILEAICERSKNIELPDEDKDIFHYQMVSAFYGRDLMKFNIDWFEQLLNKVRNGEI